MAQIYLFCSDQDHFSLFFSPYCKFGKFRENFIFSNSVKRHICHIKKMRLGHELSTLVKDRVIMPFHNGFILMKLFKNIFDLTTAGDWD